MPSRASASPKKRAVRRRSNDWKRLEEEARRFGIKEFRPGQREILEAVLGGKDVLGILPTGAGKSLCYQIPAALFHAPVLVVSPLIALMQDQQERATEPEIAAANLNSSLRTSEEREALESIEAGESR